MIFETFQDFQDYFLLIGQDWTALVELSIRNIKTKNFLMLKQI